MHLYLVMVPAILKVSGDKIVDGEGKAVLLRGAGLGGWMNQASPLIPRPRFTQPDLYRKTLLQVSLELLQRSRMIDAMCRLSWS